MPPMFGPAIGDEPDGVTPRGPICPSELSPQHWIAPVTSDAHVKPLPAVTEDAAPSRVTGVGTPWDGPVRLSPSSPCVLLPQQATVPPAPTAHVCVSPAAIAVKGASAFTSIFTSPIV